MRAHLADGPLAGREIEVDEPRPTLELADDASALPAGDVAGHRYRLASVDPVTRAGAHRDHERIAVYAYCADAAHGVVPRAA